jgi:RND family efflux transporter MFP subunit
MWKLVRSALPLLVLLVAACEEEALAPQVLPKAVKTVIVAANGGFAERRFSGVLAADATRLSFSVGGRLLETPFREGETFKTGMLLARLDPTDIEREITSATARLQAARGRLADAQQAYDRQKTLFDKQVASKAALDKAEVSLKTMRSELVVAETDLQQAEERLRKTRLVAESSGVVIRRLAKSLEEVSAGEPVYEVGADDALDVELLVPEQLVPSIAFGMALQVDLDGLASGPIEAHVSEVAAAAETGNAFRVKAELSEAPAGARSGMTATVRLDLGTGQETLFDLPLSAVALGGFSGGSESRKDAEVFVFDPAAGRVVRRAVRIERFYGNRVLVSQGLSDGEHVVVAGVPFLRDGESARLWTPPE